MPRLETLSAVLRNLILALPVPQNDSAPFTRLAKPLAAARVALVTTAGLHLASDRPFAGGDPSFREIPADAPDGDLRESHVSITFDRTAFQRDPNVVFPRDRLRELVERGVIGSLGPACLSFMGAQRDATRIRDDTAPRAARLLLDQGVDVVVLTPT